MPYKYFKFESPYCNNFYVTEEHQGNVHLFPHTEQLPVLHQALEKEFRAPLSQLISRVSAHSTDYWKLVRKVAVSAFCHLFNSGRSDKLHLYCLLDENRVARITIVQQITEYTNLGPKHRFMFYGGPGFIQEIHLSGRRVVFANHVLARFQERANNLFKESLDWFLYVFFDSAAIGMSINGGNAIVLPGHEQFLAFTYIESPDQFVFTTCLDQSLVRDLKLSLPVRTFNLHYGKAFIRPRIRNWNPIAAMLDYEDQWMDKRPLEPMAQSELPEDWPAKCRNLIPIARVLLGHGADSKLCFLDNIPGPKTLEFKVGDNVPQFNEAELVAEMFLETIRPKIAQNPKLSSLFPSPVTKDQLIAVYDKIIDLKS